MIHPAGGTVPAAPLSAALTEDGVLAGSGKYDGLTSARAREAMRADGERGGFAKGSIQYRLLDWGISRQRYWGAPIPIVYCDRCGTVPVPEKDLPVVLPLDVEITGMGESPLAKSKSFVETQCPQRGATARRETDTMDTFVESSWYFDRFACADYHDGPLDRKRVDYWMPVD